MAINELAPKNTRKRQKVRVAVAAKSTSARHSGPKPNSIHPHRKKSVGLRRAALDYLTANSPTPEIFDQAPKRPPFDPKDK
jgi:hypothetical protein